MVRNYYPQSFFMPARYLLEFYMVANEKLVPNSPLLTVLELLEQNT